MIMKIFNLTVLISTVALLATQNLSLAASGGGSDGTRGGGETVFVNGKERLRDLVDPSVCEDRSGAELRAENPEIDRILDKVAKLDWYFAVGLRWSINRLDLCFTERLIRLRNWDYDSVIAYEPYPKSQAAIRFIYSSDVYVDRSLYNKLSVEDQAFLVIHEAMHDFIPLEVLHRNEDVRAVVKALAQVANGRLNTLSKLYRVFDRNFVVYPRTQEALTAQRAAIEFALGSSLDRSALIAKTSDLNSLFTLKLSTIEGLTYVPQLSDLRGDSANRVAEVLEEAKGDLTLLDKILSADAPIEAFDPLLVALSVPRALESPTYLNRVLNSKAVKNGTQLFSHMKNKRLHIGNQRIVASDGYQFLGVRTADLVNGRLPALSVHPFTMNDYALMPAEVRGLIRLLADQANRGIQGWSIIQAMVTQNEAFYEAFSTVALQKQLASLHSPILREDEELRAAIPALTAGFRLVLLQVVTDSAGQDAAKRLDNEINWSRLGLTQITKDGE